MCILLSLIMSHRPKICDVIKEGLVPDIKLPNFVRIFHLSGVGTSRSNMAFSGFDSSSTESNPVTCCGFSHYWNNWVWEAGYLEEPVKVWMGRGVIGHFKQWLQVFFSFILFLNIT